jgi:hypothetical protein
LTGTANPAPSDPASSVAASASAAAAARRARGPRWTAALVAGACLALCALRLTGCYPNPNDLRGSGVDGGGGGGVGGGCVGFATAWCKKFSDCQPIVADYVFGSATTCQQRMQGYCNTVLTAETDTGWTPSALATCAASWPALLCANWINDPAEFPGAACRVSGKRPQGASCFRDLQCTSSRCAFANDNDSCGTCVPLATQGQPCSSSVECAVDLGCADSGACAAWGKLGEACGTDRPCLATLQCTGGLCAALAARGASCSDTVACDLAQGLSCNLTTNTCGTVSTGSRCDNTQSDGTVHFCTAGGRCNDDGSCTPAAADGKACSDTDALCVFPAFCSLTTQVCTQQTTGTCGGAGNDGGADSGTSSAAAIAAGVTAFSGALCNHVQTCAPRRLTQVYGTLDVCTSRLTLSLQSIMNLPDIGWTAAQLMACASAQTAQSCVDLADGKIPAACDIAGTRASGRGCRVTDQCASLRCSATANSCGQCLARAGAGATCASDNDCQHPLVCAVGATGGVCVTPGGAGATCDPTTTPCRYSLSCRTAVCATPGTGGVSCSDHEDCDDRNGWLCNAITRKCGSAIPGNSCLNAAIDGTVPYCNNNGLCTTTGSCIAGAGDNQACSATGAQCLFPASCVGGVCTLPSSSDCP